MMMAPIQLKALRLWARACDGSKLTQEKARVLLGLSSQSTLSKAESGESTLATETLGRYIELLTPHVLFISGNARDAGLIASAYIVSGEQKTITETPDGFAELLKMGLDIVVLTDDKTPYLALIEQAMLDSGLQHIPTRGLKINEAGQAEPWND